MTYNPHTSRRISQRGVASFVISPDRGGKGLRVI
jgi:hypothetical protein